MIETYTYFLHILYGAEVEIEIGENYLKDKLTLPPSYSISDALTHQLGVAIKEKNDTLVQEIFDKCKEIAEGLMTQYARNPKALL